MSEHPSTPTESDEVQNPEQVPAEAPVEEAPAGAEAPLEEAVEEPEVTGTETAEVEAEVVEAVAAPVEAETVETGAAEPFVAATEDAVVEAPAEEQPAAPAPKPTPRPAFPSPAALAARRPAAPRVVVSSAPAASETGTIVPEGAPAPRVAPVAPAPGAAAGTPGSENVAIPVSDSAKHGRVAEDGTVYVVATDGSERAVGSYPGATDEEALAYFARKYDEVVATANLLAQRLASTDVSAHDARQSLAHLKEQIGESHFVGDIAALETVVAGLEESVAARSAVEAEQRAAAKAEAATVREKLVLEAEKLAASDPARLQWKQASARVRELLDEWKAHQRSGPRLDKDVEGALWQRFSGARSTFDKNRKAWFSRLDEEHAQAKATKQALVEEAERLSTSTDWGATAGAFKRLMQDWKRAGRASRADDDALWTRFKAAQDAFFDAKDAVVAAEEAEYSENLKVKEAILVEAEALSIEEGNLEQAKAELRKIQDRWDAAGKVPRNDVRRVEGRMRAVEQKVRDIEDARWKKSDPELNARAQSMLDQLERAVQGLESDLAAAQAAGDDKKVASIESELATKKLWLESVRGGL